MDQVQSLWQELAKMASLQPNLAQTQSLLSRLRKIALLNQIASEPNRQLNTDHISPYNYEATLRLVQTAGAQQLYSAAPSSPLSQLRSWIDLFSFGSLFGQLTSPTSSGSSSPYDPDNIRLLVKIMEEKSKRQQLQQEQNQLKNTLERLIENQSRQQAQIDSLLKVMANNTRPVNNTNP